MNRYELDETQATWREGDPVLPHDAWSPVEKWIWIWTRLQTGEVAELGHYPDAAGPREFDPKQFDRKRDDWRRVSARFLEMVLLEEPFRGAVHRRGVRILGAWFDQRIEVADAELIRPLWLDRCRLDAGLLLTDATCRLISLDGSRVEGTLDLQRADIGQNLFMREGASFRAIVARGLKVGGQLNLDGSRVEGTFDLQRADIGQSLLMRDGASFKEIVAPGLKVGGQLSLSGSRVEGKLNLDSADIGQSLFMRDATLSQPVDAVFAHIRGGLDLRGATLAALDLTGATIDGELLMAGQGLTCSFQEDADLNLRNAKAGAVQDSERAWPARIELDEFTFGRFGGLGAGAEADVAKRGANWFIEWLKRDEPYTRQPYQQCARVLSEMGHAEMAAKVLYAGRERERKEAWRAGEYLRAAGLAIRKWLIGYGYGQRLLWHPLGWATLFVGIGWLLATYLPSLTAIPAEFRDVCAVLSETTTLCLDEQTGLWRFLFSLDMLLAIVELSREHTNVQAGLDGIAYAWFVLQRLFGWILALFIVAGLTGLTR